MPRRKQPAVSLTPSKIWSLKCPPGKRQHLYADATFPGFGLVVYASGVRSFTYNTSQGRTVLGNVRDFESIDDAYAVARQHKRWHREKRNIRVETARAARSLELDQRRRDLTLSKVFEEYARHPQGGAKWSRSTERTYRNCAPNIWGDIGDLSIFDITKAGQIISAFAARRATSPIMVNTMYAVLRGMWRWLIESSQYSSLIEHNPTTDLHPTKTQRRESYFPPADARRLYEAAGLMREPMDAAAVRLIILLGSRRNEVANLTWENIDLSGDAPTITLGRAQNKTKEIYVWPLVGRARALIEGLPRPTARRNRPAYVFSSDGGVTPIKSDSLLAKLRKVYQTPPKEAGADWRLHDIRHSLVTFLSNTPSFTADDIKMAIQHVDPSIRSYTHAEQLPRKMLVLEAWEGALFGEDK